MLFGTATEELHSSSAAKVAGNDDVLVEILVRTPVRSLIRFKCVSQHWLSLISSSHLSLLHTLRHPNCRASGLLLRKTPSLLSTAESEFDFVWLNGNNVSAPPFTSLNFAYDPLGIKILQSCNGLLLCCSCRRGIGKTRRNYYVYNPTTKQYSTLPPTGGDESSTVFGVSLAFDPRKSAHYKAICVRTSVTSICHCCIDIYSSETRTWKSSGDPFATAFDMVFTDGVFCNGSIYWISPSGASLRFDVDRECLEVMPRIPFPGGWEQRRYRHLWESNGHLHLIEIYGSMTTKFDVFEMDRDSSKWSLKYKVDLDAIVNAFPRLVQSNIDHMSYYAFSILSLVRGEDESESSLVLYIPGKVLSYKFMDNTFKELLDLEARRIDQKGSLQFICFDAYIYIETLARV